MTEFEKELVRFVSGYLDAGVSAEDYVKAFSQRLLDSIGRQSKEQPVCDGLDEAARRYATEDAGWNPDGTEKFQVIQEEADAFKAGAMWDREQGVSFNTEVGWIDGPTIMDWPDDCLDGFEMGDKVIVQIRKKDE